MHTAKEIHIKGKGNGQSTQDLQTLYKLNNLSALAKDPRIQIQRAGHLKQTWHASFIFQKQTNKYTKHTSLDNNTQAKQTSKQASAVN